jgi:hypothetical protein
MVNFKEEILNARLMLTDKMLSALPGFIGKAPRLLPYYSTVYYVEVLYFMFMMLIIYGRTAAVISGLVCSGLLTFHVIGLFFLKNRNRKIQIILMDIHIAFTAGFLVNRIMGDFPLSGIDEFMIIFRGITSVMAIPLILIFTDDKTIKEYS